MNYQAKDFSHLKGLSGISDQTMANHFKLYEGYVKNTNLLFSRMEELEKSGQAGTPDYAEIKRRFGWEWNGMRLHEFFFSALSKNPVDPSETTIHEKIKEDFGSFDGWRQNFINTASARGIGWTILYFDPATEKLLNVWVNEHDQGHLASAKLILNLDLFEHAYMLDYGTKKAGYIEAFMKIIDWQQAEKRFLA